MTEPGAFGHPLDNRASNRPPDAALSEVDVAFLGIEDRLRVAIDQRDSLLGQVKEVEADRNRLQEHVGTLERHLDRAATYWRTKWMSARRTIKLLMLIGGSALAVETIALAGMLWRMLLEAAK